MTGLIDHWHQHRQPATGQRSPPISRMTTRRSRQLLDAGADGAPRLGTRARSTSASQALPGSPRMLRSTARTAGRAHHQPRWASPWRRPRGEVEKSAVTADYYAAQARAILADRPVDDRRASTRGSPYEPMGLVLAVMPWNFPFWQVMRVRHPDRRRRQRRAAQALAQRHRLRARRSSGLRAGRAARGRLSRTLVVAEPRRAGGQSSGSIADDRIAAVTLTGSNRAGEAVGAAAGRASKRSVLELGGSDAFVVLADADVEAAAAAAVRARFTNAGQSCVCAKRFIVEAAGGRRVHRALRRGARALRGGRPDRRERPTSARWPATTCATALQRQVDESVAARRRPRSPVVAAIAGTGWFFEPTVLPVDRPGHAGLRRGDLRAGRRGRGGARRGRRGRASPTPRHTGSA